MKKFSNFCGIFATAFVTTTIILLASCSQDDDYYDSEMYTLAEMGTRLAEEGESGDPGWGGNTLPQYYLEEVSETTHVCAFIDVIVTAKCSINFWSLLQPKVTKTTCIYNEDRVRNVRITDYQQAMNNERLFIEYNVLYDLKNGNTYHSESLHGSHTFDFTRVDSLRSCSQSDSLQIDDTEKKTLTERVDSMINSTNPNKSTI